MEVVCARPCPKASETEFTSVSSALRWVMLPTIQNQMLMNITSIAVLPRPATHGHADPAIVAGENGLIHIPLHGVDDTPGELCEFLKSVEWKRLAGRRLKGTTRDFLPDLGTPIQYAFSVCVLANETVSFWLEEERDPNAAAKLADLVWPAKSLWTIPLQLYSGHRPVLL